MASGVTDYGCETWLAALFAVGSSVTSYYVALCTDQPGVDTDGTALAALEPDDVAYVRQAYGTGSGNWALAGSSLTTLNDISFPTPALDWELITHYALCSSASAGEVYAFGEFLNPQFVTTDVDVAIPAGGVVITLSALENSIDL